MKKKQLFFLFVMIIIFARLLQAGQNVLVQAKPDDGKPIVIDNETDIANILPFDTNKLFEPALMNNSLYKGYTQGESSTKLFEKQKLYTYFVDRQNSWAVGGNLSYQLDNGNFIVLILVTTLADSNNPISSEQVAVYLDSDGNVIDIYRNPANFNTYGHRFEGVLGKGDEPDSVFVSGKENNEPSIFKLKIVNEKIESTIVGDFKNYNGRTIDTDGFLDKKTGGLILSLNSFPAKQQPTYPVELVTLDLDDLALDSKLNLAVPNHRMSEKGFVPVVSVSQINQATNGYMVGISTLANVKALNYVHAIEVFKSDGSHSETLFLTELVGPNDSIKRIPNQKESDKFNYFITSENSHSKIIEVDLTTEKAKYKVLKEFEPGTNLMIQETDTGNSFDYFGYLSGKGQEFEPYPIEESTVVSGVMDTRYNVQSVSNVQTDSPLYLYNFTPLGKDEDGIEKIAVYGKTQANVDENFPENVQNDGVKQFFGVFKKNDEYAPVISEIPPKTFNLKEVSADTIDQLLLIDDIKQGTFKVYDQTDSNKKIGELEGQDWLNKRINRNPLDITRSIDWAGLGFDFEKTGPQLVTYFVWDSQQQITTNSRWVTIVTDETIKEEKTYLDAQNFSVPLATVKTDISDENTFKELAQTMAWNEETYKVYEDGKEEKFSDKVTVNEKQLKELQEATVAKPYPVDVTIEVAAINGSSTIEITNRVWVFVTTKNTVVDKDTSTVIYADDYRLPLQSIKNEKMIDVYLNSNVRVYNYYDNTHETVDSLPTIADSKNITGLNIGNLEVITGAKKPGAVYPNIKFTWDKGATETQPEVTLYAELLVHARQIILNDSEELPVPSKGYLKLLYGSSHEANLIVTSDLELNNPSYKTSVIDFTQVTTGNEIEFNLVLPEYYKYKGYVVSDKDVPHQSSTLIEDAFKYSLIDNSYEIWLTQYIEPITSYSIRPYNWKYQQIEMGKFAP